MTDKICKIYTLEHPLTGEIRYVGKTEQSLSTRLIKHIHDCKRSKTHRNNWIQSLLNQDLKPVISLLEEVDRDNWEISEKYWISQFKAWDFNLVNGTNGGEAVYKKGETFEQKYGVEKAKLLKEKLSKAQKNLYSSGYINPTKGKPSQLKGRKRSKEAIDNWRSSRKGYTHSDNCKLKISKTKLNGRTIVETDLEDNIIKRFDNIYEVISLYNLKKQSILDVLCGQQKTTHGHRFKYINL